MIKIYELIKQNAGRLVTNYCGVSVTLNFDGGNTVMGKNAELVTNSRFIQDAIENDDRFGVTIKLGRKIAEADDNKVPAQVKESKEAAEAEAPKKKAQKKVQRAEVAQAPQAEIETVFSDVNDAVAFLEEKGEVVETPEQMVEMLAKYGARIEG